MLSMNHCPDNAHRSAYLPPAPSLPERRVDRGINTTPSDGASLDQPILPPHDTRLQSAASLPEAPLYSTQQCLRPMRLEPQPVAQQQLQSGRAYSNQPYRLPQALAQAAFFRPQHPPQNQSQPPLHHLPHQPCLAQLRNSQQQHPASLSGGSFANNRRTLSFPLASPRHFAPPKNSSSTANIHSIAMDVTSPPGPLSSPTMPASTEREDKTEATAADDVQFMNNTRQVPTPHPASTGVTSSMMNATSGQRGLASAQGMQSYTTAIDQQGLQGLRYGLADPMHGSSFPSPPVPLANIVSPTINTAGQPVHGYCFDRGGGMYTRLIPADMLPPGSGIPPVLPDCQGMMVLQDPTMPPSGQLQHYQQMGPVPSVLPTPVGSIAGSLAPLTAAFPRRRFPQYPQQAHHPQQQYSNMLPAPQLAGAASVNQRPSKKNKVYCDKWVHEGICAFTQQGCKFKHEMPHDRETQRMLGLFQGYPAWFKKMQSEQSAAAATNARAGNARELSLGEAASGAASSAAMTAAPRSALNGAVTESQANKSRRLGVGAGVGTGIGSGSWRRPPSTDERRGASVNSSPMEGGSSLLGGLMSTLDINDVGDMPHHQAMQAVPNSGGFPNQLGQFNVGTQHHTFLRQPAGQTGGYGPIGPPMRGGRLQVEIHTTDQVAHRSTFSQSHHMAGSDDKSLGN